MKMGGLACDRRLMPKDSEKTHHNGSPRRIDNNNDSNNSNNNNNNIRPINRGSAEQAKMQMQMKREAPVACAASTNTNRRDNFMTAGPPRSATTMATSERVTKRRRQVSISDQSVPFAPLAPAPVMAAGAGTKGRRRQRNARPRGNSSTGINNNSNNNNNSAPAANQRHEDRNSVNFDNSDIQSVWGLPIHPVDMNFGNTFTAPIQHLPVGMPLPLPPTLARRYECTWDAPLQLAGANGAPNIIITANMDGRQRTNSISSITSNITAGSSGYNPSNNANSDAVITAGSDTRPLFVASPLASPRILSNPSLGVRGGNMLAQSQPSNGTLKSCFKRRPYQPSNNEPNLEHQSTKTSMVRFQQSKRPSIECAVALAALSNPCVTSAI